MYIHSCGYKSYPYIAIVSLHVGSGDETNIASGGFRGTIAPFLAILRNTKDSMY